MKCDVCKGTHGGKNAAGKYVFVEACCSNCRMDICTSCARDTTPCSCPRCKRALDFFRPDGRSTDYKGRRVVTFR